MKNGKFLIMVMMLVALLIGGCTAEENKVETTKPPVQEVQTEQTFTVYRTAEPDLVAEKYTVKDGGKAVYENALKALVEKKPLDDKLTNEFPQDTKVLGVVIKDGVASANFSKELLKVSGGSLHEMLIVGSIVNTLTEFPEIKKVQILVEGKKIETLNGHMDLTDPLERDESLMPKKK